HRSAGEDKQQVGGGQAGDLVPRAGKDQAGAGARGDRVGAVIVEHGLVRPAVEQEVAAVQAAGGEERAGRVVREVGEAGGQAVTGRPLGHDGGQRDLVGVVEGRAGDEDVLAAVAHQPVAAGADDQVTAGAAD